MTPPVAFCLARLFIGPLRPTPRGIDRVELGYARHFLNAWPGPCVATLPTPWGVRCVPRKHALRIVDATEARWKENIRAEDDPLFAPVKTRLNGGKPGAPIGSSRAPSAVFAGAIGEMLRHTGNAFGGLAARTLPRDSIYINTGQHVLAVPRLLRWLGSRPDIKPVFMLHDTIPIDHGQFVPPSSRQFHRNMMMSTARYASGLIVTTEAAGQSVRRELRRCGRDDIPFIAEPLPVSDAFGGTAELDDELRGSRYFVVTGSIEPRKNHLLLLNVWREFEKQDGSQIPKLVMIGSRWRGHRAITDAFERSAVVRDHVIEVAGLSTPALRRLLSNACALLMPSFAEGFGLPIIEALAVGTPVIASDIPAHREAGGNYATFLGPNDTPGWLTAIRAHLSDRQAHRGGIAGYTPHSWPSYMRRIEPFLLSLDTRTTRDVRPAALPVAAQTEEAAA